MKACVVFTGSGPIVVLTTFDSFNEPDFVEKLTAKGLNKFIAYEVSIDKVKEKYGNHYDVIMGDLRQTDDLRVLDYDGHHVFKSFSFDELEDPVYHEG